MDDRSSGSELERLTAIVRGAIERHGGYVFATGGDGFCAAFSTAANAAAAAVESQRELSHNATVPFSVRGPAEMVPGQHHVRMNMYIARSEGGTFRVVESLGHIDPQEAMVR